MHRSNFASDLFPRGVQLWTNSIITINPFKFWKGSLYFMETSMVEIFYIFQKLSQKQ